MFQQGVMRRLRLGVISRASGKAAATGSVDGKMQPHAFARVAGPAMPFGDRSREMGRAGPAARRGASSLYGHPNGTGVMDVKRPIIARNTVRSVRRPRLPRIRRKARHSRKEQKKTGLQHEVL